jgi:glycosyltransferase involved in cell wall biosynthesis
MTGTVSAVYRQAMELDADVYHVHDPELMPVALLLRMRGKKVIYDSHEHLPQQISTKPWIPRRLRRPLALVADRVERSATRFLAAVVTAEPYVQERFLGRAPAVVTVNNYPLLEEFPEVSVDWAHKDASVCYVGSITELRGAREMVAAIERTDATLLLAGRFAPAVLETQLAAEPGWSQVEFLGQVARGGLTAMLTRARAGLVVLHPVPNYVDANPTKMFEYMSAGIPVIASDFPAWASIVNRHACGICVDPMSPAAIADAIQWLLEHADEAQEMGRNGRRAVETMYNWEAESSSLLELYQQLTTPAR